MILGVKVETVLISESIEEVDLVSMLCFESSDFIIFFSCFFKFIFDIHHTIPNLTFSKITLRNINNKHYIVFRTRSIYGSGLSKQFDYSYPLRPNYLSAADYIYS